MAAHTLDLPQLLNELTIPGLISYVIQQMKVTNNPAFSWITKETPWITKMVAVLGAGLTAAGMSWTYTGGTLTVKNLTVMTVLVSLWHVVQNYLLQHGWYQVVFKDIQGAAEASVSQAPPANPPKA